MRIKPFLFLFLTISGFSQQAVPAAGGTVSDTFGSFSVSVGQAVNGYLQNATHTVSQGVQQTYAAYTTQVKAVQCGTVLANLDTAIVADTIVGAQKYRFEVTNGNNVSTIENVNNSFTLAQFSGGACFNTAYAIRVAVQYGSLWYDYGTSCTVTTPDITPTAAAQTLCASATVANLTAIGTAIKWYTTASGGTALAMNNILITKTYFASQTINGCESLRAAVAVTVTSQTTPTFTQISPVCSGGTLTALPTTSNNGITGTWLPEVNSNITTTYTFTPTAGQCANATTQTITITAPKVTSPISFVAPVAAIPSVTIGTQTWTAKNLDVATYSDGTPIPQVTDPTQWQNLTTGAWCYYNNDSANGATYGKLYNWYAVAGIHDADPNTPNKILAPTGYHIPSDAEWTTLTTYLGGESVAGNKMKAITGWTPYSGITNTNISGFTGLPGGYRYNNGAFYDIGYNGYWWSSSETSTAYAWFRFLYYDNGYAYRDSSREESGFSVRCLRD